MNLERLNILCVSQMPASPPRFGAQARMHGLMTQLARRHELTAAVLVDEQFDADECRRAMQAYCREVVMIPNPYGQEGLTKRLLQLRSLASVQSFERLRVTLPTLQQTLDRVLHARRFDVVNLEFPYLGRYDLRQAPPGERVPPLVVDLHDIEYDLVRQFARTGGSLGRRLYAGANWRKLRREELRTYRDADGVYLCSAADERRLLNDIPDARTTVIPNAADVDYYQPRPTDPPPDGRTVVYFGLLSTVPNVDGVIHFVQYIWPRIAEAHPQARCKIIGGRPPAPLLALAGPRVELTGFVPTCGRTLPRPQQWWCRYGSAAAPASRSSRPWRWGRQLSRPLWAPRGSRRSPGAISSSRMSPRPLRTRYTRCSSILAWRRASASRPGNWR